MKGVDNPKKEMNPGADQFATLVWSPLHCAIQSQKKIAYHTEG